MASKIISQKRFARLLNAATGTLSQQPGSVLRVSNMVGTQRGSLQTCDGSSAISDPLTPSTLILDIASYSNYMVGAYPYYTVLAIDPTSGLDAVTNVVATPNQTTGTGSFRYHYFGVVATAAGGHTDIGATTCRASFISHATSVITDIAFTWDAVAGATGYKVYYLGVSSTPILGPFNPAQGELLGSPATNSLTFTLPFTGTLVDLPYGNTTQSMQLFVGYPKLTGTTLAFSEVTAGSFLATVPQPASVSPGGPGFVYNSTLPGFSPYGGVPNAACPISMQIQFAGKSILVLGNSYAPQEWNPADGTAATVSALTNTFQAAYSSWQANVAWVTNAQLYATDGVDNFLFTATQGGVSGATTPSWVFTDGVQIADGSVIWTCSGIIANVVAPRGAAHAISYAGSLWLANTSPQTTSDGIDGPTCIKMSDSNNPNSWNPVNTAFLGKDDGTQITGMAQFTIAALGISPTGSLAVFKEYETYQIIGVFGSQNFEIIPAQTDMGCLAARSIQFIPGFGICRWTHLGFAVFDGVNDKLISEEIRPYLFGGIKENADIVPVDPTYVYLAKSAQTSQPPMYMCAMPLTGANGAMTRIFCYDLVLKGWTIIDLPWPISALNRIRAGEGGPLVLAGRTNGTIERLQAGDAAWNAGEVSESNIGWNFTAPDIYGEGSSQRLFFPELTLRGWATDAQAMNVTVTATVDGVTGSPMVPSIIPMPPGSGQFEIRFNPLVKGQCAHVTVEGHGQVVIDSIDWQVVPLSPEGRRVIG